MLKYVFLKMTILLICIGPILNAYSDDSTSQYKIKGELSNRYDKVYRYIPQGRLVLTDHFKSYLDLGLNISISQKLNVIAAASVTKYWNQWYTQNVLNAGVYNLNIDERYRNDEIHLSLAYFDYHPVPWFNLWGGRLPTSGGAPTGFYENQKSEDYFFPKLAFGSEVDGAIGIIHLDKFDLYLGYIPYLLQNFNFSSTSAMQKPTVGGGATEAETLAPRATTGIRYNNKNMIWAKNLTTHLHYSWLNYLRFPDATVSSSYIDPTFTGTSTLSSNLSISLTNLVFHFQINSPNQWPLEISATYLLTSLKSSGVVQVTSGSGSGRSLGGYGTQRNEDTLNGSVLLIAIKADVFNLLEVSPFKAGAEWLQNSGDGFYADLLPDDPTLFYSTRGDAWHFYIMQDLTEGLNLRGGYRKQQLSYNFWSVGSTQPDSSKYDTFYVDVKVLF